MMIFAYPSDAQARAEIIDCGIKLYQRGLVAANDGNISIRTDPNTFWITPTGVSKGFMSEGMLVKVDLDGNILEGINRPSTEIAMHLRIYRENPDTRAVVHAHPPCATAFAAAGMALDRPFLQESVLQLGPVPVAPFALPGTPEVAESVAPYCRDYRALLLEYHGAVTWGDTIQQAQHRMECLEQTAQIALHLHTLGCMRTIPPELVSQLEAQRPARGIR